MRDYGINLDQRGSSVGELVPLSSTGGHRVFSGRYNAKLDGKSRFILPAKLRNQIIRTWGHERPHLVLTLSFFKPCLVLMSEEQWGSIGDVSSVDLLSPAVMDSFRLMSMVSYTSIDEVGRLVLPDYLKEMVGIQDKVTLLGCRAYVELWAPEKAEEDLRQLQANAPEVMARLREELAGRRGPDPDGGDRGA